MTNLSMNLTAIAIDDEPPALETIKNYAARVPFLDLKAIFTTSVESIPMLQMEKIDLIFLDVLMPDMTGIEFKEYHIKEQMVIFTTAHGEYAKTGFDLDIVDFLEKPFPFARFVKSCNKALEQKLLRANKFIGNSGTSPIKYPAFIFIKTGDLMEQKILLVDILYIKAQKTNYLEINLRTGKRLSTRNSIAGLLEILPPDDFVRVNRSCIIALDKVDKIGRHDLIIANELIPFGPTYESEARIVRAKYDLE